MISATISSSAGPASTTWRISSLRLPRDRFIVIRLSARGKSSAFDTLYAEGQRRYVESLSAYARQFFGLMEKPDVDLIEGLSPAISIDQKGSSRNPRSTVGTVTEIYDYLRLMFARIGQPHCPSCGTEIHSDGRPDGRYPDGTRRGASLTLLLPMVRGRKGEYGLRVPRRQVHHVGEVRELEQIDLDKKYKHDIAVIVDRLVMKDGCKIANDPPPSSPTASSRSRPPKGSRSRSARSSPACTAASRCPSSRTCWLSTQHCPYCRRRLGAAQDDPRLVVPDGSVSIDKGALLNGQLSFGWLEQVFESIASTFRHHRTSRGTSCRSSVPTLFGTGKERIRSATATTDRMRGSDTELSRHRQASAAALCRDRGDRQRIEEYIAGAPVPGVQGRAARADEPGRDGRRARRPRPAQRARGAGLPVHRLELTATERLIGGRVIKEVIERLTFLNDVVGYLSLQACAARAARAPSSRPRSARRWSACTSYIGLHQRDNRRLIDTLFRLRDLGNTVIVVEHDEETMRSADHIVDMGPGAGEHGGQVVAEGTPAAVMADPASLTGDFLAGRRASPSLASAACRWNGPRCAAPACTTCAASTSPSRSRRSPASRESRGRASRRSSTRSSTRVWRAVSAASPSSALGPTTASMGHGSSTRSSISTSRRSGATPRSNPATYTGVFDDIRQLFSQTPERRAARLQARALQLQRQGRPLRDLQGRRPDQVEMQFLPDVYVPCEACRGKRYNRETLEVWYRGKKHRRGARAHRRATRWASSPNVPRIARRLKALDDVGLGYVKLGQPATTLSGGEAQRVKLASELSKVADRQDAVHPRRAHHRPALRRHRAAPRDAAAAGRRRATRWSSSSTTST